MAGLVAADRKVRDAGDGRSFAQVRNLRAGAGPAGEGRLRTLSCSGQPVGNFPSALPPRGLGAPDASGRFLRPLRPLLAACERLRSRSPHPRLPPSPGSFRIWTELEEQLQTLPLETPPHSSRPSLPHGPPALHPRLTRAGVAGLTMKSRALPSGVGVVAGSLWGLLTQSRGKGGRTSWGRGLFGLETLTSEGAVRGRGRGQGGVLRRGSGILAPLGLADWMVTSGTSEGPPSLSLLSATRPPPLLYNAGFRGDPEGDVCVCDGVFVSCDPQQTLLP